MEHAPEKNTPILWYRQPATHTPLRIDTTPSTDNIWQQTTLPIGNGDFGATIYGEVHREHLVINEKTLWTGGPGTTTTYNGGNSQPHGKNGHTIRTVQQLFENGHHQEAAELARTQLIGAFDNTTEQGGYEALEELIIEHHFPPHTTPNHYHRELNLHTGIATTEFTINTTTYRREILASHPQNIIAIRLTTTTENTLNITISLPSKHDSTRNNETRHITDNILSINGTLHSNGLHYSSLLAITHKGGTLNAENDTFTLTNAHEAVLYLAAATNFQYTHPTYRNNATATELTATVHTRITNALNTGWEQIKKQHIHDHTTLMGRLTLKLGPWDNTLPTDELLNTYATGKATPAQARTLETLLYQMGRYLTIASSRHDSQLPANLQGLWARQSQDTDHQDNPWKSDYHLNVNLQMNYWPTYSANLAESAEPLIRYVEGLVTPGRITAQTYNGTDGTPGSGYTAHTETTPYGWTAPGRIFTWGWSPASTPWILQNVYEAYTYTQDETLLKERIYPLLREQTEFYINHLLHPTTDAYGKQRLASSPTYSPEHGPVTDGNTFEQTLIWQLIHDTIEAARILKTDTDKIGNTTNNTPTNWTRDWDNNGTFTTPDANRSWACALSLLHPIEVGQSGQIKEWYDEGEIGHWKDGTPIPEYQTQHRHLSHLLGLFPGDLITIDNPTYMNAAKVSLDIRQDNTTGWGIAQRINAWTRTGDGNRAHKIIASLMTGGIYPNLFDAHPPFQIDGNFGYTAAVNEMLLQSNSTYNAPDGNKHHNYLNILPALPHEWNEGEINGIRARGNFTANIQWREGKINTLTITSGSGLPATLAVHDTTHIKVTNARNVTIPVQIHDSTHFTFATQTGEQYTITFDTGQ